MINENEKILARLEKEQNKKDVSQDQATPASKKDVHFWLEKIDSAGKREKNWRNTARRYERKYLNHNNEYDTYTSKKLQTRYNIFYSNTELLKSALLPEIPSLSLERRFAKEQAEDEREKQFYTTVSEIVERTISYNIKNSKIEKEFEAFKYDYLITGRGILWVTFAVNEDNANDNIQNERVEIEHIHYNDFRMSSGKKWEDIWWIGRRHLMNRQDLIKRFGNKGKNVELTYEDKSEHNAYVKDDKLAEVWEIWDKTDKRIYFVSQGYDLSVLESKDDPYHLDDFFPTVEPLRSIKSNRSLTPTPELDLYIKEADDLTEIANRIARIIRNIKPRAFYAAQFSNIVSAITSAGDNEYIGIDESARINEMGGMNNMFAFDPIDTKQAVAAGLYQQQENLINNIYEITGISDIMRNISADETATATLQKGRFGSLRLQGRQTQINNYIKEIYKIATELVCELFSIRALQEITSMQLPTNEQLMQYQMEMQIMQQQPPEAQQQVDPKREKFFMLPTWEQVKEFLENNRLRSYLIDIETSFNIFENEDQAQRSRIDLLNVFSDSVAKALPLISEQPQLSEVYFKMISFALDSFKVSRTLKNGIDDTFAEMIEGIRDRAGQEKTPTPDQMIGEAEIMKAQAEQMNAQTKMKETEVKLAQLEIKIKELELKAAEVGAKIDIDEEKVYIEDENKKAELGLKNKEIEMKHMGIPII